MVEPEFVTLHVENGVGTIRLNRPKMNAIDEQLHRAAQEAREPASRRGTSASAPLRTHGRGTADGRG